MRWSVTRRQPTSASGQPKALNVLRPTLCSRGVATLLARWRFRTWIPIHRPLLGEVLQLDPRVVHPVVVHPCQDADERLGDEVQVLQGQITLVQFSLDENIIDEPLNDPLDPGW